MPNSWERLYLDFDGYFAAVEEQASPALHGRPVAVLPYPEARTCVISANAAAKRHGVGAVGRPAEGAAGGVGERARGEAVVRAALNERYGRTVVGLGHCGDASSAAAGYAGAKIAYGRIPDIEDFR